MATARSSAAVPVSSVSRATTASPPQLSRVNVVFLEQWSFSATLPCGRHYLPTQNGCQKSPIIVTLPLKKFALVGIIHNLILSSFSPTTGCTVFFRLKQPSVPLSLSEKRERISLYHSDWFDAGWTFFSFSFCFELPSSLSTTKFTITVSFLHLLWHATPKPRTQVLVATGSILHMQILAPFCFACGRHLERGFSAAKLLAAHSVCLWRYGPISLWRWIIFFIFVDV